jgi:hypothetical protein
MLVKILFVIGLLIFSSLSFFVDFPPGTYITDQMNFSSNQYSFFSLFTKDLLNGVFFGFIITAAVILVKRKTKQRMRGRIRTTRSNLDEIDKILSDTNKSETKSSLTEIKGIGPKRAIDLELAGVKTVYDLANRSPKHLAKKTGIPITQISKWIVEANKLEE